MSFGKRVRVDAKPATAAAAGVAQLPRMRTAAVGGSGRARAPRRETMRIAREA